MSNITYIYLVENCYNDPNKIYIGKTKNSRKGNHKKTYGAQIKYTVIDSVFSLDRKYWEPLETYWIEQFKAWGFIIMNTRQKGGSGPEYLTNEQRSKIKQAQTNKNHSYLYTPERRLKISNSLKNKYFNRSGPTASKPVYQLDPISNHIIKEWPSASTAANELNINKGNLTQCLKKQRYYKTVGGYSWEYK
jgi:hypothetical protein